MTFVCGNKFVGCNTFGTFPCEISVHLGSTFDCAPINSGLSHPYWLGCLETYSWSRLWEIKSVAGYCRQPYHNHTHKCTKIYLRNQHISCLYYFFWKACSMIPHYHIMLVHHIFSFDHAGGLSSHVLQPELLFQMWTSNISGRLRYYCGLIQWHQDLLIYYGSPPSLFWQTALVFPITLWVTAILHPF